MNYFLSIIGILVIVPNLLSAQDTSWLKIPNRNILIGTEVGGTIQSWKDPYTNEKSTIYALRLVPRIGVGIGDKLILGGHYEYEFSNQPTIPKIHGYGFFARYYCTFWDAKINKNLKENKLRVFPYIEGIYNKNNTFYESNTIVIEENSNNKFSTVSLGAGIDIKLFRIPFYINVGYRSLFFADSPEKKILWIIPKLEFNLTF